MKYRITTPSPFVDPNQSSANWDSVKSLVSVVSEQPIVLMISENKVSVRFDY